MFISSDLVPLACGVDVTEHLVRCVTDQAPPLDSMTVRLGAAGYVCRVVLDDIKEGTVIGPLYDKTTRIGPILIKGSRRKDLDEIYRQVQQTLRIEVKTDTGTAGPIRD